VTRFGLQFTQAGMSIRLQHLADRVETSVRVTAHALRRAAAAHCQAAGMNLREIQEMLGHSQVETTVRYTGIAQRDLAEAVGKFHPRGQIQHKRGARSMDKS
jgi:site-specific recombinase XerD